MALRVTATIPERAAIPRAAGIHTGDKAASPRSPDYYTTVPPPSPSTPSEVRQRFGFGGLGEFLFSGTPFADGTGRHGLNTILTFQPGSDAPEGTIKFIQIARLRQSNGSAHSWSPYPGDLRHVLRTSRSLFALTTKSNFFIDIPMTPAGGLLLGHERTPYYTDHTTADGPLNTAGHCRGALRTAASLADGPGLRGTGMYDFETVAMHVETGKPLAAIAWSFSLVQKGANTEVSKLEVKRLDRPSATFKQALKNFTRHFAKSP